jgi:hypothetical protein
MKTEANKNRSETGFVVGYKFFNTVDKNGLLYGGLGIGMKDRYDTATCAMGARHQAPHKSCTCGHHLRWEPDHFYGPVMAQCVAYGKVWLWTEGCRAEKIRIDCIYLRPSHADLKDKIEKLYKVPVVISDA